MEKDPKKESNAEGKVKGKDEIRTVKIVETKTMEG